MQSKWIKKDSNDTLILMFMGWACDEGMLEGVNFENCDILSFFDYSGDLNCVEVEDFSRYEHIVIVAWSFGVWVADFLSAKGLLPKVEKAMAINGTVKPIHNDYGIREVNFRLTVKGLERVGLSKFYENICSEKSVNCCKREDIAQINELKNLEIQSKQEYNPVLVWDLALVGLKDVIFNPKNMINYWDSVGVKVVKCENVEHYPFSEEGLKVINSFLDGVE